MKTLNDFLLNLFTGNDELRPALNFPNLEDGVVCATDGHVLIAIPEDELLLKYETNKRFPKALKTLNDAETKANSSIKVSVSDIAVELTKARITADKIYYDCEECSGKGEVEVEYRDKKNTYHYTDIECPVCKGERKFEDKPLFARVSLSMIEDEDSGGKIGIKVGEILYHPFQLYRLFMVAFYNRCEEIEIFYSHRNDATITHFGNVKVLIMPMFQEDKAK